jgi:mismatch-specific thymine-DNA glycosylase
VLQIVFVMPSSSARCSQLPRAIDKVPFYVALKKLRDYVRGELVYLDESEVTFPDLDLKIEAKDDQLANS